MSKHTLNIDLMPDSIQRAIDYLTDYSEWLSECAQRLSARLAALGQEIAEKNNWNNPGEAVGELSHDVVKRGKYTYLATIYYKGDQVAFIEFGAGVHYNGHVGQSTHKYGEEFGFTIGSYGYGLGRFHAWKKPDGEWTNGIGAQMPMLKASEAIQKELENIAEEVFRV